MTQQPRSRRVKPRLNGVQVIREITVRYRRSRHLKTIIDPPEVVRFVVALTDDAREHMVAIYLDGRLAPIGWQVVSIGSAQSALVHPREIFQPAVHLGACAVLLAHTHPSGDPQPSAEDRAATRRVFDAGKLLGIQLLDHVVVGAGGRHWSFREQGEMPEDARRSA